MDLYSSIKDSRSHVIVYNTYNDENISYEKYPLNISKTITYGKNGNEYFTYLNGELIGKRTITDAVGWSRNVLYLGRTVKGDEYGEYYFNGTIKSVRIYNRELTQEEILNNYNIDKQRFNLE